MYALTHFVYRFLTLFALQNSPRSSGGGIGVFNDALMYPKLSPTVCDSQGATTQYTGDPKRTHRVASLIQMTDRVSAFVH